MSSPAATSGPLVLADAVPPVVSTAVRDAGLVLGAAALTGLAAQVVVPLPFTPVPLTLQTFAVLGTAAALGTGRALAAMLLYAALGIAGVPWFAGGGAGWGGASFGYILGFVLAGVVVGALARRGASRTPLRTAVAMAAGTAVIYAAGVPWLMAWTGMDLPAALAAGVVPFLVGDALKALGAAVLLPSAWRLVDRD